MGYDIFVWPHGDDPEMEVRVGPVSAMIESEEVYHLPGRPAAPPNLGPTAAVYGQPVVEGRAWVRLSVTLEEDADPLAFARHALTLLEDTHGIGITLENNDTFFLEIASLDTLDALVQVLDETGAELVSSKSSHRGQEIHVRVDAEDQIQPTLSAVQDAFSEGYRVELQIDTADETAEWTGSLEDGTIVDDQDS